MSNILAHFNLVQINIWNLCTILSYPIMLNYIQFSQVQVRYSHFHTFCSLVLTPRILSAFTKLYSLSENPDLWGKIRKWGKNQPYCGSILAKLKTKLQTLFWLYLQSQLWGWAEKDNWEFKVSTVLGCQWDVVSKTGSRLIDWLTNWLIEWLINRKSNMCVWRGFEI